MSVIGETLAFHLSLFGELPEEDRAAIVAVEGQIRELKRHKDIIRHGDLGTHSVVVLRGLLQRYTIGPEGKRQIHSFYLPSDSPCLETLYIDYMDNNLGAAVDSEIGLIPNEQLYRLIGERAEVRKLIFRETLVQGAIFREWLMRNSNMAAHARIAHLFCEMFTRASAAGLVIDNSYDLPITQETLSDAVGLTPVHVNRTLQLLRDAGAVDWRSGRVTVNDWDMLSAAADFDPQYLHLRTRSADSEFRRSSR
jgi:CRP-like cAMP-binding protein